MWRTVLSSEPPPYSFFVFLINILRDCMEVFRPIRPTVFEKNDLLLTKNKLFEKCIFRPNSLHSLKLASGIVHKQTQRPLFYWVAKCQLRNFFQKKNDLYFFNQIDQKLLLLNVHFLVNYANFEIYSCEKFFLENSTFKNAPPGVSKLF